MGCLKEGVTMKKFIAILLTLALLCSLPACELRGYDEGYEEGYNDGRFDGRCDGYADGIEEAQSFLAFIIEDDLSMLGWEIEETYGVHPEDALLILSNYADVPDEVTEEELHAAIWAIYRYYYKSHEVIDGIKDYCID